MRIQKIQYQNYYIELGCHPSFASICINIAIIPLNSFTHHYFISIHSLFSLYFMAMMMAMMLNKLSFVILSVFIGFHSIKYEFFVYIFTLPFQASNSQEKINPNKIQSKQIIIYVSFVMVGNLFILELY